MNVMVFNLFLMCVWLCVFVGLLCRDVWMSPELLARVNGPQTPLVIAVAGALCIWNFLRFWVAYKANRPPEPAERDALRQEIRRKLLDEPKVTDPQLNFEDPPPR